MSTPERLLTLYLPDAAALRRLLGEELERGALYVPTIDPPPLASRVAVRIQVADLPQPLELEGTVIHTRALGEPGELGPGAGLIVPGAARAILAARRLLGSLEERGQAAIRSSSNAPRSASEEQQPPAKVEPTPSPRPSLEVTSETGGAPRRGRKLAEGRGARPVGAPGEKASDPDAQLKTKVAALLDQSRSTDHYRLLGVPYNATAQEIRKTFFRLAKIFHPDAHFRRIAPEMTEALEVAYQKICEAYQVLANPETRMGYDLRIGNKVRVLGESQAMSRKRFAAQIASRFREQHSEQVGRARSLFEKSLAAQRQGDIQGAKGALKLALTYDPFHQEARELLESLEQEGGSWGEAAQGKVVPATGTERRNPTARPAQPRPRRTVLTPVPRSSEGVRSEAGRQEADPAAGRRTASMPSRPPADQARLGSLLGQARKALAEGKKGAALIWVQHALVIEPGSAEALTLLEQLDSEE